VTYSGSGVSVATAMSPRFIINDRLADGVRRVAEFTTSGGVLMDYSVVLLTMHAGAWHPVRVYDNAHGANEMHRHTLSEGKQPAEVFHFGTASEAYNVAWRAVAVGYEEMIDGWQR
jgi:hypothetical protein